ncbi:MAG: HAD-IC family P-type ATPase [Lachnospiraceae bacterium]|nr:HAD-IC family P-type ATPase [Lachnospiraceae bacterium]
MPRKLKTLSHKIKKAEGSYSRPPHLTYAQLIHFFPDLRREQAPGGMPAEEPLKKAPKLSAVKRRPVHARRRKKKEQPAEIVRKTDVSYDLSEDYELNGLSQAEIRQRIEDGQINISSRKGQKTVKQIVRSHTITYFNIMNLLLGLLIFLTGQYKNMLFLGTIICNSLIGIAQELKVKQLIDRLSVITASRTDVLREGKIKSIPVNEIVLHDVLIIKSGDQIVTDGRLISSQGLEVNESMLTGESKPVHKKKGDKLLSGSFITAGTAVMSVEKVGDDCYAAQLVSQAQNKKHASSEMQRSIGKIIKVDSIAIIPIGLLLFRSQYIANPDIAGAVVRTVSGVIGMIPEGLVLLTSVSFILGVGRLAQKRALVQEMESIEALARINVLCTDKTGTITSGKLEVSRIVPFGRQDPARIKEILGHLNGAFTDTNATQEAMDKAFGSLEDWDVSERIPFSSDRKYKGASFLQEGAYLIGAPEFLIPGRKDALKALSKWSSQGYRVLLLAKAEGIREDSGPYGTVSPIAAIILSDIIKPDARKTFRFFADAGVHIKVLSGDNPVTVSAVAQKAGVEGAEHYIDASELPADPEELARVIDKYTVFGRVKPEQKQAFVKAWQANGQTVGMVGDGVNDVLAIKDADCGIAMASGSDAAKQAAHIVLLDSDFSSMKDIVREGKTIISNIERVSSLYLTKTIYSALLSVIFILIRNTYPWTTLQLGLINVCGIGLPSFLLTLEHNEGTAEEGFLKHVLQICTPAALAMAISILIVQALNALFGWSADLYSSFTLMLGGVVSILVVAQVCWPLNTYRRIVLMTSIFILIAAFLFLPGFYDIRPLWTPWSLLFLPLSVLVMWLVSELAKLTNKVTFRYLRWKETQNT